LTRVEDETVTAATGSRKAQPSITEGDLTTVAELLVDYLRQLEVEYVFGVPGGAIEPFYSALARSARRNGPRPVLARHETGAAFMADGYAQATGRLGVCCATSGPGATNLITGIASAFMSRAPVLAVTAQSVLRRFGSGAFQESSCDGVNSVGIFQHCTRYNTLVSHPDQAANKFYAALDTVVRNRAGPVHLSVPVDVFNAPVDPSAFRIDVSRLTAPAGRVDALACEQLCALLGDAKHPLMVMGGGCGRAAPAIVKLAERVGAPIITTPKGKGAADPYHPLFCGVVGVAGHDVASRMLNDSRVDLILVAGASLSEWDVAGEDDDALWRAKVVHIDSVTEHFRRSPLARLHVGGDLEHIFAVLSRRLPTRDGDWRQQKNSRSCVSFALHLEPAKSEAENGLVDPRRLMAALAQRCPEKTLFLPDVGNSFIWATHYLHPRGAGRCRVEMEYAAMGWAIGAAVGAAMARRGQPVVCITGDGSMLMNGQEITVAQQEGLSVLFVVLNDAALGMVRHGQRLRGAEAVAFALPPVDFAAFARSLGVRARRIATGAELEALDLNEFCSGDGPALLDVLVDPEQEPPMRRRIASLEN
jgi:acetolactate synthase-1/2/3 large subunit